MTNAVYTVWLRNMKRYFRSKSRIIGSLAQPLLFLLVLGFGLGSIIDTSASGAGNYLKFIAPGIITMSVLFTSIFSGIQIIWDRQFGFLKETLVAPVSRISIMIGQTLGGATTAVIQGLILFLISLVIGGLSFNSGVLIALVFMVLIGIGFTAMGIAVASRMRDMQGFQLIINFVVMPLFFLSGALFPLTNAPAILRTITYLNPLTYGVEGVRYGIIGTSSINPLISLAVIGGFSLLMIILGAYSFRKMKI
jgi:ABC-2 type transport system permease protein